MTFESMFGPRTPSPKPNVSTPRTRQPRAPKGYETINGKVYKKAEGYYSNRCPGSLVRIAWYRVKRNLGAREFQCSYCGAGVVAEYQGSVLGYWNYPVHDRPSGTIEHPETETIPEGAPF